MERDLNLLSRAYRLNEVTRRRHRQGKTTRVQESKRLNRIALAHYRLQHAAGATDYPQVL